MGQVTEYVLGFLFSPASEAPGEHREVVLIEKKRPEWQAGFLNGVGGKVEPDEFPCEAMAREFREETGAWVSPKDWCLGLVMHDNVSKIYVYGRTLPRDRFPQVKSMTDENVVVADADFLPYNVLPNLRWIVPFLLDDDIDWRTSFFVKYKDK